MRTATHDPERAVRNRGHVPTIDFEQGSRTPTNTTAPDPLTDSLAPWVSPELWYDKPGPVTLRADNLPLSRAGAPCDIAA